MLQDHARRAFASYRRVSSAHKFHPVWFAAVGVGSHARTNTPYRFSIVYSWRRGTWNLAIPLCMPIHLRGGSFRRLGGGHLAPNPLSVFRKCGKYAVAVVSSLQIYYINAGTKCQNGDTFADTN